MFLPNPVINFLNSPGIYQDTLANRPQPGIVGRLFISTDQTPEVLQRDTGTSWETIGGTGTVTSIGITMPSDLYTVTGSPVTGSGTIAVTEKTQAVNSVWAGPGSGPAATPAFRLLVINDIPDLSSKYLNITTAITQNKVFASPNGSTGVPSFRPLVAADIPDLSGTYLKIGGNTFGTTISMGTNDSNILNIKTNNTVRIAIAAGGIIRMGSTGLPPVSSADLSVLGAFKSNGFYNSVNTYTVNTSEAITDCLVIIDCSLSSAGVNYQMLSAGIGGKIRWIKKADNNPTKPITIFPPIGGWTIEGASSYTINNQYACVGFFNDDATKTVWVLSKYLS